MSQTAEVMLPSRGPFDLRATALSAGDLPLPPWTWVDGRRAALRRAEELADGTVVLVEVRAGHGGVIVRLTGRRAADAAAVGPVAARVRRALRLDQDLRTFHRLCREKPAWEPIARLRLGRLLRGTTVFEDVVRALLGAPGAESAAAIRDLCALGRRCPADSALRAFPTPSRLAASGVGGRAHRGLDLARTLAREVLGGSRDLEHLAADASALTDRRLSDELGGVRGLDTTAVRWLGLLLATRETRRHHTALARFLHARLPALGPPLTRPAPR